MWWIGWVEAFIGNFPVKCTAYWVKYTVAKACTAVHGLSHGDLRSTFESWDCLSICVNSVLKVFWRDQFPYSESDGCIFYESDRCTFSESDRCTYSENIHKGCTYSEIQFSAMLYLIRIFLSTFPFAYAHFKHC